MLYCSLLGSDCIEEKCAQYDITICHQGSCHLYAKTGHFLYTSASPVDLAAFVRYIEGIRPKEKAHVVQSGSV